jgi:hypothetical protein
MYTRGRCSGKRAACSDNTFFIAAHCGEVVYGEGGDGFKKMVMHGLNEFL